MRRLNTLKSLDGLRVGVTLIDTTIRGAELCVRQFVDNTVGKCLHAHDVSVGCCIKAFNDILLFMYTLVCLHYYTKALTLLLCPLLTPPGATGIQVVAFTLMSN